MSLLVTERTKHHKIRSRLTNQTVLVVAMELIPGLPEDMSLQCLVRLPPASQRSGRGVGRRWKELIDSPEFYRDRKRSRNTRNVACLVQAIHNDNNKPAPGLLSYGITLFHNNKWARLNPIPNGTGAALPLFCQLVGVDGELVVMGGWHPDTWEPLRDVWVYSFAVGRWRRGREMPVARSGFAAAGGADGRVYVAGGHDEGRNVLCSAAYYDVKGDEWVEMASMMEGRDECEGVMVGDDDQFWVVGGFGPEEPGRFVGSAEVYDTRLGRWRRVEGVWPEGRRPRGCVGVREDKTRLVCWAEAVAAVRVGMFGVRIGERVMVSGMESAAPGATVDFYMLLRSLAAPAGQNDHDGTNNCCNRLERVNPPVEFSGFVQSGCCVEI